MSFLPPLALSSSSSLPPLAEHLTFLPPYLLVRPGLRDLCDSGWPALEPGEKGGPVPPFQILERT